MSEATFNPITPVDGGAVAPYSPSQPLVPVDSQWDIAQPDYLMERQGHPADVNTWFGQPIAPGAEREIDKFVSDASAVFSSDMEKLGFSRHLISAAENWYRNVAFAPTPSEVPNHRYSLAGMKVPAKDQPWLVSFLNKMGLVGAPETFIRSTLWWYSELCRRIQTGIQGGKQSQTAKPAPNLNRMSDKQLQAEAQKQLKSGMAELQTRWGVEFKQRLNLVMDYLAQFPVSERIEMEQRILPNGRLAGSDPDFIEYIYQQATGGSIPSGAALAAEIKQLETFMKTNRRAYIKDEPAQARLRLLYEARGH